jgi:hypothetical protein
MLGTLSRFDKLKAPSKSRGLPNGLVEWVEAGAGVSDPGYNPEPSNAGCRWLMRFLRRSAPARCKN